MAIITRPNKVGGGTDVIAGNDVLAEEWNGDLNTIYTDYDGNITDANCSPTMNLQGSKLADAPAGITVNKINDSAVETAKIKDGAVTTNKILDVNVTAAKLATDSVIAIKLKTTIFSQVLSGTLAAQAALGFDTALGNTIKPICVYIEATTTVLQANSSNKCLLSLIVWWNTTTNSWWLTVGNPTAAGISLTSATLKLEYVPAS